jgi:hypothetical protein
MLATERSCRGIPALAALLLIALPAPAQARAGAPGIGTVTALQGEATVTRTTAPSGTPLRFKDAVFFRDQITTRERSIVRLLLSGRGVLTVREQSQVTLEESQGPDGRRSVITLHTGKIGAAIVRGLMRPGEQIEIHTPNSVAAVRGTVFIVEYTPADRTPGSASPAGVTTCFVLSGTVAVSPHGRAPVLVGAQQAVTVAPAASGVQVGPVRALSPADVAGALRGLETERPAIRVPHGGETLVRATAAWATGASSSPAPEAAAPHAAGTPASRKESGDAGTAPPEAQAASGAAPSAAAAQRAPAGPQAREAVAADLPAADAPGRDEVSDIADFAGKSEGKSERKDEERGTRTATGRISGARRWPPARQHS